MSHAGLHVVMFRSVYLLAAMLAACLTALAAPPPTSVETFDDSQAFLKTYCQACHQGKTAQGGFDVHKVSEHSTLLDQAQKWMSLVNRVKNGEMPPKGAPAPSMDLREQFTDWVDTTLRTEACSAGIQPGPAVTRRLNRDEYMATVSDLFDMHMDVSDALPVDGAGGEGFDNAAETLFLSPLHAEKYMDLAKFVLDYAAKEHKSREKIFTAKPGNGVTARQAANRILRQFLPRAFRRPITDADIAPYQSLFDASYLKTKDFEPSVLFALKGVLVSPQFLYRVETPGSLDQYELASRLSYFLWGSMPDELLFDVAAAGKLNDPEVMKYLIGRMVRNDRFIDFSRRFTGQWLRTRDLDGTKAPDAKLFPMYASDEELRGDIRFQPILFFREIFLKDMSLLNFIDSKGTIGTMKLQRHFGTTLPLRANARMQPQWVELPPGSNRGGLLGMPAVLAVSSHPYRSSPVLRGAWILDTLLGTPPPPPPPNVPPLEEHKEGAAPTTVRERLTQHRENPVCASCHSRIDGLGFALENYDTIGRWRDEDAGKPIDNTGELNDGTKFKGPAELRAVLLERKDLFVRNLASKMLGYALGRGLTLRDSCAVDAIVAEVKRNDYSSRSLLEAVVFSVPFQQQAPVATPAAVRKEKPRS